MACPDHTVCAYEKLSKNSNASLPASLHHTAPHSQTLASVFPDSTCSNPGIREEGELAEKLRTSYSAWKLSLSIPRPASSPPCLPSYPQPPFFQAWGPGAWRRETVGRPGRVWDPWTRGPWKPWTSHPWLYQRWVG